MTAVIPDREPGVYESAWDGDGIATDWEIVPWHCGPVWDKDPTWDGPRDPDGYILPRFTLGWQAIHWGEHNLLADETDEHDRPLPFSLTNEQIRFVLWFYALDDGEKDADGNWLVEPSGRFAYREFVLQRLKGWGKDPLAAFIAAVEFVGPCRFAGWCTTTADPETQPEKYAEEIERLAELGLEPGDPYAKPHPRAWIQIAAVSLAQTQNTMSLFRGLFTDACKAEHSIDIGMETIYAYHGQKKIEAVTSSPKALEGNRPTLVIKNETHHWLENNNGIEMADAIERNATKAKGGAARTLSITNAPEPSQNSVGMQERDAYEQAAAGLVPKTGLLYDSLEAPPEARMRPKMGDLLTPEEQESRVRRYLAKILDKTRGDAWWLDIPSLVDSILSPKNKPSRSRRFWFNQVVAAEDAWADPAAVDAAISRMAAESRELADGSSRGVLEAGWLVHPDDPVVLFFDGSKSDDSTAVVGARVSDGYTFTVGVWQKPPGKRGETWLAPRGAVDDRVREAFVRFNVVAFWADPSHTKDDEDGSRYWDGIIDGWMRDFKDDDPRGRWKGLDQRFWPLKSGHNVHAIMFDMTSTERQKLFIAAAEEFIEALEARDDIEEYAPQFKIDGHPALLAHMKNARRYPTAWGVSLMKDGRESSRKIDLAVAAVGCRMLRRVVLNKGIEEEEQRDNTVWGFGF